MIPNRIAVIPKGIGKNRDIKEIIANGVEEKCTNYIPIINNMKILIIKKIFPDIPVTNAVIVSFLIIIF